MSRKNRKRRLISELMERDSSTDAEGSGTCGELDEKFFVHSSNSEFNSRQRDVFTGLNQLEKMHAQFSKSVPVPEDKDVEKEPLLQTSTPSMDGQFKHPSVIRKRQASKSASPDYIVHPERWTKYSLSDVDAEQLSEKSNTAAAMSFLDDCKKRKVVLEGSETPTTEQTDNKILFRSRKFVMPVYTVGQKPTPKKSICSSTTGETAVSSSPSSAVHLSHLEGDTDGNEENPPSPLDAIEIEIDPSSKDIKGGQNDNTAKPKRSLRKHEEDDDN